MTTAARRNVALVRAGTWSASTGVTKITRDDLLAMQAAYADHVVDRPVIKLGHDDANALNAQAGVTADGQMGDGEPAFGWLANVAVGDGTADRPDPDVLYGDYVGMPAKLAEVSDTAWRRRSVEISWGVKTAAGKTYTAVLTGVALLGVAKPAVKGLADVLALYSAMEDADRVTTLELVDGLTADQVSTLAAARAEVTALAEAYQIPADKRDEALERLDRLAGVTQAPAPARDTGAVPPAAPASPDGERDQTSTPAVSERTSTMPITKADVDAALAKAGDEDVTELLKSLVTPAAVAETAASAEGDQTPTGTPAATAPVTTAATAPAAPSPATGATPEGVEVVQVSKSVLTELQTAAGQLAADRRVKVLTTALSEGKITPAERGKFTTELADGETASGWAAALERDEAGTTTLLSAMQPRFATTEPDAVIPSAYAAQLSEQDQAAYDAFMSPIANL